MNTANSNLSGRLNNGAPDLSIPAGRAIAYGERMAVLTGELARGGYGLSSDAALEKMRATPGDAELLSAMGGGRATKFEGCNSTNSPVGLSCGLAANIIAVAIGKSAWIKLTPYVDGDYWEQDKMGRWVKFRQVVTPDHGARLVAAFNDLKARRGADFRGLPIYAGHPDADPQRWPDERRLGGVMGIEARADGIYVQPAWNDLGQKNLDEGYLVYPSPAWPYDLRLKASTGRIEPIELRSIGMTNTPRIAGVPAWTNSDKLPENLRNTDLSTPEKRRQLFNARIDMLTRPKPDGGEGLTFQQAWDEMQSNPLDAPLLRAMSEADLKSARR